MGGNGRVSSVSAWIFRIPSAQRRPGDSLSAMRMARSVHSGFFRHESKRENCASSVSAADQGNSIWKEKDPQLRKPLRPEERGSRYSIHRSRIVAGCTIVIPGARSFIRQKATWKSNTGRFNDPRVWNRVSRWPRRNCGLVLGSSDTSRCTGEDHRVDTRETCLWESKTRR